MQKNSFIFATVGEYKNKTKGIRLVIPVLWMLSIKSNVLFSVLKKLI